MKNIIKTLALVLALGFVAVNEASATKINGVINFSGTGTLDDSPLDATKFLSFTNVTVSNGTQTGAYLGTDGASATFTPFTFNPNLSPAPVNLWTFTSGGLTYSFRLDSIAVNQMPLPGGSEFLLLTGQGLASITGLEDTYGSWMLSTQGNNNTVTLSFSATSTIPDGGATAALLGCAVVGLAYAKRRFGALKA